MHIRKQFSVRFSVQINNIPATWVDLTPTVVSILVAVSIPAEVSIPAAVSQYQAQSIGAGIGGTNDTKTDTGIDTRQVSSPSLDAMLRFFSKRYDQLHAGGRTRGNFGHAFSKNFKICFLQGW